MLEMNSQERKDAPVFSGVLSYFPKAMVALAQLSKAGNDKHNPGEPLHWSREKSKDHADCIARHLLEHGIIDPDDGFSHTVKVAWRALALLEVELENPDPTETNVKWEIEEVLDGMGKPSDPRGNCHPDFYNAMPKSGHVWVKSSPNAYTKEYYDTDRNR